MRLTVIGCSPAWPNPGGAHSGYLVEGVGSLLLDCGPGVLARLRLRDGWPKVDAIAITHFHLDHWGDLVPWATGAGLGDASASTPTTLWLPPGGAGILREFGRSLALADFLERAFDMHEYEPGAPFEAAGHTITAARVPHYDLDAYGFRVDDGERRLAYSGDSSPTPALAELARDADLFLCEATLQAGELDARPRGHLAADEAEAAFLASGARELLLTHRPAELPPPAGCEVAHDGLIRDV